MNINGFDLPNSFIKFAKSRESKNGNCGFDLKRKIDSFDRELETELSFILIDETAIAKETNKLPALFGESLETDDLYIDNFDAIVCFGFSGDDAPFCFDFRDNQKDPSVIWWDDDHWRKISDSFNDFISLFESER